RCNQCLIGATVPVLFEGESTETALLWQGRMQTQAPEIDGYVLINDNMTDKQPVAGDFVNVKITAAYEYDLLGRIV
ncbi:MAG: TRAM domain-containing protein, partial [Pyrinomonadaceae bacterium]